MLGMKVSRWVLMIFGLVAAGIIAGILLTNAQAHAAPAQPISFSHRVHTAAGVQCLYCHSGAQDSAVAGIPSVQKCMGCHSVIDADKDSIKAVADYFAKNKPIDWVAVNQEPDFVYFSHQPHLGAGLNCETCHGNVGQMDADQPAVTMDMGWCLNCHLKQPPAQVGRLTDCLACHK
jgi:c(7)-type cytochrome triheme protein